MFFAAHDAEVVHAEPRVDRRRRALRAGVQAVRPFVPVGERIDVHGQVRARLREDALFDFVRKVVCRREGECLVYLRVHRRVHPVAAVAVHGQIVQPAHAAAAEHAVLYAAHGLPVGRAAEQFRDRLFQHRPARKGDEHRHEHARVPVQRHARIMGDEQAGEHRRRCGAVGQAVRRRRFERVRAERARQGEVEGEQEQFDGDRRGEHEDERERKAALLRRKDALHGLHRQLRRDGEDEHSDDERRHGLRPPVPEGVFAVRGLAAHPKADQRYRVRPAVGEVVDAVRQHRDHARYRAECDLRAREQQVACNAQHPRKDARARARADEVRAVFPAQE